MPNNNQKNNFQKPSDKRGPNNLPDYGQLDSNINKRLQGGQFDAHKYYGWTDTDYPSTMEHWQTGVNTGQTYGDYRFVTIDSIISAFMTTYVGEQKLINKVSMTDVQFHAFRATQELSYDILRSFKNIEISVPNTLRMPMPHDYVNYVKVCRVDSNGIERVLYPTGKTSNPFAVAQDSTGQYLTHFTKYPYGQAIRSVPGDVSGQPTATVTDQNLVDDKNLASVDSTQVNPDPDHWGGGTAGLPTNNKDGWNNHFSSKALKNFQGQNPKDAYSDDNSDFDVDQRGRRYGLDPQHAQVNGTFFIDDRNGYIHFGSSLAGETITLKYVSDGLGTADEMVVHKFCEEAVYKWIAYGILSSRSNIPEYIIQRFKKEKFAETRKAKIRLSNIKIEEFTQVLKGLSKPIK